jgi:hypothetical protein
MTSRVKPTLAVTAVAALSFAGAFAVARATRADGDAALRVTPVYYGPAPSVRNLDSSVHTPLDPGAAP